MHEGWLAEKVPMEGPTGDSCFMWDWLAKKVVKMKRKRGVQRKMVEG